MPIVHEDGDQAGDDNAGIVVDLFEGEQNGDAHRDARIRQPAQEGPTGTPRSLAELTECLEDQQRR